MSERSQKVLVWWTVIALVIYAAALGFLFRMLPPPSPTWSAERVAEFYSDHATGIKLGAVITGWTGAFLIPLSIVLGIQVSRLERGRPVWSAMTAVGGIMATVFLTLPPFFFGVAAYTPGRAPEITATMHELGVLSLITTDQYFVFMWVAIVVICLTPSSVPNSPFPRWFGYFSAWATLMFEAGAIAFMPRVGPFAWNGMMTFCLPFSIYGVWMIVMVVLVLKALTKQAEEKANQVLAPL